MQNARPGHGSGVRRHRPAMSAAVRARTVLAAADRVQVHLDGAVPPDGTGPARGTWVVQADDGLYLLAPPGAPPRGRAELRCSADAAGLGSLLVAGRCGDPVPATRVPGLAAALGARCPCRHAGPGDDPAALVAVPVDVDRVRVVTPAGPHGASRVLPVPVELFRAARPDEWALRAPAVAGHLEEHHQRELQALARHRGAPAGTTAVVVRDLAADRVVLTCLADDGLTDLSVEVRPAAADLDALGAWFRRNTPGSG